MTDFKQPTAEERADAVARMDAAFHRYNARPHTFTSSLEYERQRADDASSVLCFLIGAIESTVGSDYLELTPARVAAAVELAVEHLFKDRGE